MPRIVVSIKAAELRQYDGIYIVSYSSVGGMFYSGCIYYSYTKSLSEYAE